MTFEIGYKVGDKNVQTPRVAIGRCPTNHSLLRWPLPYYEIARRKIDILLHVTEFSA
jgi:hypothetical protein